MISLVILKTSCISVSSKLKFLRNVLMMLIRSSVGMFVYMFEISKDAILRLGSKVMSDKSFISWIEF
jgi:hypothetical protein